MLRVDLLGIDYEVGNDQNVCKYIEQFAISGVQQCFSVSMKSHIDESGSLKFAVFRVIFAICFLLALRSSVEKTWGLKTPNFRIYFAIWQ